MGETDLPLGIRNNNPGNLRFLVRNPFNGQIGENKGFGVYDTMSNGIRAAAKQVKKHIRAGYNNIELLINRWAPSTENNTEAYIKSVILATGIDRYELLHPNYPTVHDLCVAIFYHENGVRLDPKVISEGVARAFEGEG